MVTGAGGDIGRAIAAALASTHHIAAVDIDRPAAQRTAAALHAQGGQASIHQCDLTDAGDRARLATEIADIGTVGLLVNNAGAAQALSLHELTAEALHADIALNLEAAINMFKQFEGDLKQAGCVINIASVNGMATFGHPGYSAAKSGLIHFTRMLAVEYGRYGLRANAVAPGTVRTQAWEDRQAKNPQVFEDAARWYPLRRVADPTDVAAAVAFLASPSAGAITGVCLPVDCGLTAGSPPLPATFTQTNDFTGNDT
ncbi:SDR family oxidoreductase (plasmid) [Qingshengfaniella alkalisoli]|uniref:SDR family oxidoreductase n=1 Tax=Qingshengfaniella alkalisoli TaxID=2599296 RepID=A0A5B8IAD4_9RHOB|nr:SDR family oxidoreductase [Qingshengfaniella alkalisoli]